MRLQNDDVRIHAFNGTSVLPDASIEWTAELDRMFQGSAAFKHLLKAGKLKLIAPAHVAKAIPVEPTAPAPAATPAPAPVAPVSVPPLVVSTSAPVSVGGSSAPVSVPVEPVAPALSEAEAASLIDQVMG